MYSSFQILLKYLRYYFKAANGKGHGIHSPFVYQLTQHVFCNRATPQEVKAIEQLRKNLRKDQRKICVEDYGAGSNYGNQKKKSIDRIAKYSLKSPKYARLMFRLVQYFKPSQILELGTSLGLTTAYMAMANKQAKIYTIEGSTEIASLAREHFHSLGLHKINTIPSKFEEALPSLLEEGIRPDFIFIDGHHAYEATLRYFFTLVEKANGKTILILDDIHWSREMEDAWAVIQQHPKVTLTIDLFFVGLVFLRNEQLAVQHFTIRY